MKIKWEDGSVTNETWETVEPLNKDSLVYVMWDSGILQKRDSFGGYYSSDLKPHVEKQAEGNPPSPDTSIIPKEEPKCPCWDDRSAYCPKCKNLKTSDLKSKYEALLRDLKEEREAHYAQGNHAWVSRLDGKIEDLEETIEEKFGNEKEGGAQNATELTVMDHTPPRANSGPDVGGKDSADEFQDEWAEPKTAAVSDGLTYPLVMNMTKEQLMALPTIDQGHFSNLKFDDGKHRVWVSRMTKEDGAQEDNAIEFETLQNGNWVQASLRKNAIKINIFNKNWSAEPVTKEGKLGYVISDESGKKVLHLSPLNGREMNADHLKWATERELTHGYKQAKLVDKISFLDAGTKVYILATDKTKGMIKIASLDHGVRGWVSESKIKLLALESQIVAHGEHQDRVLGQTATETLLDCIEGGPTWVNSTTLLDANRPLATPESLNDLEEIPTKEDKWKASDRFDPNEELPEKEALKTALPPVIPNQRGYLDNPSVEEKVAEVEVESKSNMDVINMFVNDSFPKDKMPVWGTDNLKISKQPNGWALINYQTPIAYRPNGGDLFLNSDKYSVTTSKIQTQISRAAGGNIKPMSEGELRMVMDQPTQVESSLEKDAIIVHQDGKWCVKSPKNKNWNGGCYNSREKAEKRLQTVEMFKHMKGGSLRPFSKKAEVLSDPYQALTNHITDMRSRMTQVQERLQSNPLPKQAGADEKDNSSMDVLSLLEDITMGIDLLETKLNDEITPEIHDNLEEMENLLWEVEMNMGITPELSEEEKSEPEHKEIVKEVEEKAEKEAAVPTSMTTTTVTNSPTTGNPSTSTTSVPKPDDKKPSCAICGGMSFNNFDQYQQHMTYTHNSLVASLKEAAPVPATPSMGTPTPTQTAQNVQPTDDDNLEVPTQKPTSPLPPGQAWQWDSVNGKFVAMTDNSQPGKII